MTCPETQQDAAAKEWCDKYSSPGDFEEFGQQEAFHAGYKRGFQRGIEAAVFRIRDSGPSSGYVLLGYVSDQVSALAQDAKEEK